ncbi:MAG: M14 family metallopeptidase [Acidobacteria bacterium]|nr:M14 family metallopeptidase [Acidobacteriota bacterium]
MRALFVILALSLAGFAQTSTTTPDSAYWPFDALKHKVLALAEQAPERVKVVTFGTSAGGRPLLALEIGAAPGKQAVFVGANMAGYHNAGSQAALDLAERLIKDAALTATRSYYILPALNPDAHDAMFSKVRYRRSGNGGPLDRDRDGASGEDGPNDLNQDGRITQMRIPDPAGPMTADPNDPRVMIPVGNATTARYRVVTEGLDDDQDGLLNEDGPGGERPDLNFPHQWITGNPEAGTYPGSTPEARAVMEYVLARRNIALAVVYGPANSMLAPPSAAGGTPDADARSFEKLGALYRQSLQQAGLSADRRGAPSVAGGLRNWLYHHYGVMAVEVDIWGIAPRLTVGPKAEEPITIERLEKMSNEEFLALGEPRISAYLKEIKAPGMVSAKMLIDNVKSGRLNPARMAQMMRQMGLKAPPAPASAVASAAPPAGAAGEAGDVMAYLDREAPGAFTPWTPVTLPDGTRAEVGGVDPFATIAPPGNVLVKATAAHSEAVLAMAAQLPRITITALTAEPAGDGMWKVKATVANTQLLPTHPRHGAGIHHHLPVRLGIALGGPATAVAEHRAVTSDNLCLDEACAPAKARGSRWPPRPPTPARTGGKLSSARRLSSDTTSWINPPPPPNTANWPTNRGR